MSLVKSLENRDSLCCFCNTARVCNFNGSKHFILGAWLALQNQSVKLSITDVSNIILKKTKYNPIYSGENNFILSAWHAMQLQSNKCNQALLIRSKIGLKSRLAVEKDQM